MLYSMTGFARQSADSDLGSFTWELRAVNHRYLDLQFRLPDELRPAEPAFRQQAAARLSRGKVECNLNFRRATGPADRLPLDAGVLAVLHDRSAEIAAQLPSVRAPDALEVLRWPGVVVAPELDGEAIAAQATTLFDATLATLQSTRASEGERISAMLVERCDEIVRIAGAVRKRMPEVLAAVRERQRDRIAQLDVQADPARLEVELALVAQKLDVDEELDRLDSHVVEIRDVLGRDEPVGRRLDFLMQELNREANTLASKSADADTTRAAVDLKVLIEQMREQIQNVE